MNRLVQIYHSLSLAIRAFGNTEHKGRSKSNSFLISSLALHSIGYTVTLDANDPSLKLPLSCDQLASLDKCIFPIFQ